MSIKKIEADIGKSGQRRLIWCYMTRGNWEVDGFK
jgi:hypothetical protein